LGQDLLTPGRLFGELRQEPVHPVGLPPGDYRPALGQLADGLKGAVTAVDAVQVQVPGADPGAESPGYGPQRGRPSRTGVADDQQVAVPLQVEIGGPATCSFG
jgi:hypothetical protein